MKPLRDKQAQGWIKRDEQASTVLIEHFEHKSERYKRLPCARGGLNVGVLVTAHSGQFFLLMRSQLVELQDAFLVNHCEPAAVHLHNLAQSKCLVDVVLKCTCTCMLSSRLSTRAALLLACKHTIAQTMKESNITDAHAN